jgi:hypothetical protein
MTRNMRKDMKCRRVRNGNYSSDLRRLSLTSDEGATILEQMSKSNPQ